MIQAPPPARAAQTAMPAKQAARSRKSAPREGLRARATSRSLERPSKPRATLFGPRAVAQLAEHRSPKPGVESSSLSGPVRESPAQTGLLFSPSATPTGVGTGFLVPVRAEQSLLKQASFSPECLVGRVDIALSRLESRVTRARNQRGRERPAAAKLMIDLCLPSRKNAATELKHVGDPQAALLLF
jgi:hypothetical protein